jgi:hypothetical protein
MTKTRIEFTFGIGLDRTGGAISPSYAFDALRSIGKRAAVQFGGYTLLESSGGWVSPEGNLVTEPGRVMVIVTDTKTANLNVTDMAEFIATTLHQACVMVTTSRVSFAMLS